MWRMWVVLGSLIWLATVMASLAINAKAGHYIGRSEFESQLFGVLGLAADGWKALGPIFVLGLWRASRYIPSLLAGVVWLVCFSVAVTAALGLAAQNRDAVTGGREAVALRFTQVSATLEKKEDIYRSRPASRSSEVVDSEITARFATPIKGGTVASVSKRCAREHWRTRQVCAEIATLRVELAQALETQHLEKEIEELRRESTALRARVGSMGADPQSSLISDLSLGIVAEPNVRLAIILLLVAMIELVSAFAPVVIQEYTRAQRGEAKETDTRSREHAELVPGHHPRDVMEYMAQRLNPKRQAIVSVVELLDDYALWCRINSMMIAPKSFLDRFDSICKKELGGKVRKTHGGYIGFELRPQKKIAQGTV